MKKKISLVILSMGLCTVLLLGVQLYWNYHAYQNTVRIFKSDINDALDKAVAAQINIKRDRFAMRYRSWLADTSLVTITVSYSDSMRSNIFKVRDTHPKFDNSPPFSISMNELRTPIRAMSPSIKIRFVDHFVKNLVTRDLLSGMAYYYTQQLGDRLVAEFKRDRLDIGSLKQSYRKELAERGINSEPLIHTAIYKFKGFQANAVPEQGRTTTRSFKYGFSSPMVAISATFPDAGTVFLSKMKWVLLISLLLIALTIGCFMYTVRTLLSQHQLALLKDNFVNNMTHELKTPVATIIIAAEAIQDFSVDTATAKEYLGIIRHQSANLTQLIDQVLQSTLHDQQAGEFHRQLVSLTGIVRDTLRQYQPRFSATATQLKAELDEQIEVTGNAAHLSNVVANLIDNAVNYGQQPPRITVKLLKKNSEALIAVRNIGTPIPAEYQEKIFERLFRIPTGDIHDVKGYGLGLSYVKDVVGKHHGRIEVSSGEDHNTFTIYLPLA